MTTTRAIDRAPRPQGLYDVLDLILDKGLVIDAYVRVSLVGIELLTIDARIVVASVDTYLRFAEAVGRLDIEHADKKAGLPELTESMTEGGAKGKTKGALSGIGDAFRGNGNGNDGDGDRDRDGDHERDGDRGRERARQSSRRRGSDERDRYDEDDDDDYDDDDR